MDVCGGGAGVGGLTSAGGHDGKKRSMFLKGPVCHDILDHVCCGVSGRFRAFAVVVSVTVIVLILISRRPSVHNDQSKSGLLSGPFMVFLRYLMQS